MWQHLIWAIGVVVSLFIGWNMYHHQLQIVYGLEKNIAEQESKRQFLTSLAGGINVPDILVKKAFRKENQTKTIKYIDLEKFHSNVTRKINQKILIISLKMLINYQIILA